MSFEKRNCGAVINIPIAHGQWINTIWLNDSFADIHERAINNQLFITAAIYVAPTKFKISH